MESLTTPKARNKTVSIPIYVDDDDRYSKKPHGHNGDIMNLLNFAIIFFLSLHISYGVEFVTDSIENAFRAAPEPEDKGDLIRHTVDVNDDIITSYTTLASYPIRQLHDWKPESVLEIVPIVIYWARPGDVPCAPDHYSQTSVQQALSLNSHVYFIGPPECRANFTAMGVKYQGYNEYEDVYEWFFRNIGLPVDSHIRWYILKRFMEKTKYNRVFYANPEVLIYTNVTEMAAWLYPEEHMALPIRWPSLRPPVRENQYESIGVSGHIALFSYPALVDWCQFLHKIFTSAIFEGTPGDPKLPTKPEYNDANAFGLYSFADCWQEDISPKCMGVAQEIVYQMRDVFVPKYKPVSLCQPRRCYNSSWSDKGMCLFDNNFSVDTVSSYFKFPNGQKNPTSLYYEYHRAWKGTKQEDPIQYLAVHFHGNKILFLSLPDKNPSVTWGSSKM